jgi:lysyl-tRNA synthetase class 2
VTTLDHRPSPAAARCAQLRTGRGARRHLHARAAATAAVRAVFARHGHVEIDTPLLQHRPGTAAEAPFRVGTRHLPADTFLKASPLYLRAMLTAGFDRVFEIARTFRDEPADPTHTAEYTLVEAYRADADIHDAQALIRELILAAAAAVHHSPAEPLTTVAGGGLAGPWPELRVHDALTAALGAPITPATSAAALRHAATARGIDLPSTAGADDPDAIVLALYDRVVEPATTAPTWYTHFPAGASPLAAACPHDPRLAHKADLVIRGREIATAYSELTDPGELDRRLAQRSDEADTVDAAWRSVFAFLPATAAGLCVGLERLVMTLTGTTALTDTFAFPPDFEETP